MPRIAILLIVIIGLFSTYYLANYTRTNLKPKAASSDTSLSLLESELPPALISNNPTGLRGLLVESGRAGGYQIEINSSTNDKVDIAFNPERLRDEEAIALLNKQNDYYLKTLTYLLYDTFDAIPGPPIDPWYALCDKLTQDKMERLGLSPVILADGTEMDCLAVPNKTQFNITDPRARFGFYKIKAQVLLKMMEILKIYRETKGTYETVTELAASTAPFIGPIAVAYRNPGSDPEAVAQASLMSGIVGLVGSQAGVLLGGVFKPVSVVVNPESPVAVIRCAAVIAANVGDDILVPVINWLSNRSMNQTSSIELSKMNP